jgi:hypothetical protein
MPNLKPRFLTSRDSDIFPRALLSAVLSTICLTAVMLFLGVLPTNRAKNTPLHHWSNSELFENLRHELISLPMQSDLEELKRNFLANQRINDPVIKQHFQSSGLTHLLAISGGQTGPAAYAVTHFILLFCLVILNMKRKHVSTTLLKCVRSCGAFLQWGLVFFLVGLYQSSGALGRILACTSIRFLYFNTREAKTEAASYASVLSCLWPALPWVVIGLVGTNPVVDLSFQLSLLGSLVLRLNSQIVTRYFEKLELRKKEKSHGSSRVEKHLQAFSVWVMVTAATSCFMSVLCSAYWPSNNTFAQMQANLIAGPLVLLLITPLTLAIDFVVLLNWDLPIPSLLRLFSISLLALKCTAEAFSDEIPAMWRNDPTLKFSEFTPQQHERNPHHFLICIVSAHFLIQITEIMRKIDELRTERLHGSGNQLTSPKLQKFW